MNANFAIEFGGLNTITELRELETNQTTVLMPILKAQYDMIDMSQLSRHMWSHLKDKEFDSKHDVYTWIRHNWDIEIISKMCMVSAMKTAGTKNCALCIQEHVKLFYAFNDKSKPNLMNSRRELHGRCTCQMRFLRLSAVGNEGTDETS